jgi:16S rRNA (guanine966-N2)-methyltransferase
VRIISGTYRGKKLNVPKDLDVRPTTDYAKTGLFNILSHRFNLKNISVVDLYAGTGSLSYEFISRGCTHVTAIDKNPSCIRFIRESFELLDPTRKAKAIQSDSLKWLSEQTEKYDIIVADAPFAETPFDKLVELVILGDLLKKNGLLIIEHVSSCEMQPYPGWTETRKYGNVSFSFFSTDLLKKTAETNP